MKNNISNNSNEKQNLESKIKSELNPKNKSKSLNEISYLAKQSEENTKADKKSNKFDKTTQSFSPIINHHNKSKTHSKYRELVIDTRNTPLNDIHKFDFVKYRHEKYQKHKYNIHFFFIVIILILLLEKVLIGKNVLPTPELT